MKPLVSICCITYNQENYIREALDSFLMQKTDFPTEVVIGEDCSTDRTRAICQEYQTKFPDKIKLLAHQQNMGAMRNFIDTLRNCSGKYIAICEGDDFWIDPNKLQKQIDLMESHPDYSACYHAIKIVDTSGKKTVGYFKHANQDAVYSPDQWYLLDSNQTALLFRSEYVADLPDWLINAPMGGVPLTLYLSQQGKFAYQSDIMSAYRLFVPGSFTVTKTLDPEKNYEFGKKMALMYDRFNIFTGYRYQEIIIMKQLLYLARELKFNHGLGKFGFVKKYRELTNKLSRKRKIALYLTIFFPGLYEQFIVSRKLDFIRTLVLRQKRQPSNQP